jgi:hypothetical protein
MEVCMISFDVVLAGSRAQTTAALLAQTSNGNSLLTNKAGTIKQAGVTVTKPPVVTVTSKGLTSGSKVMGSGDSAGGNGRNSAAASPVLLAQVRNRSQPSWLVHKFALRYC